MRSLWRNLAVLQWLIAAIKAHPNCETVQCSGCYELSNMGQWDEYRPLIVKAGGASAIVSVMEKYRDDNPELHECAYKTMQKLFQKRPR